MKTVWNFWKFSQRIATFFNAVKNRYSILKFERLSNVEVRKSSPVDTLNMVERVVPGQSNSGLSGLLQHHISWSLGICAEKWRENINYIQEALHGKPMGKEKLPWVDEVFKLVWAKSGKRNWACLIKCKHYEERVSKEEGTGNRLTRQKEKRKTKEIYRCTVGNHVGDEYKRSRGLI